MSDFASKNAGGVTFTELHALTIADIDGDGIQDIVTGKRHWAHLESYTDPDPHGAPVLYWFRTVRSAKAPGGARVRAGADSQPIGRRVDDPGRGSEQGRRASTSSRPAAAADTSCGTPRAAGRAEARRAETLRRSRRGLKAPPYISPL